MIMKFMLIPNQLILVTKILGQFYTIILESVYLNTYISIPYIATT